MEEVTSPTESSAGEKLFKVNPVVVQQILGDLPQRGDLKYAVPIYRSLGASDLLPFVKVYPDGNKEYIVCGPKIDGEILNALLYFVSTYKGFGLDRNDIRMDWRDLYEDPDNAERLARHRGMAGWSIFEKFREELLDAIEKYDTPEKGNSFIPVMRWNNDGGKRTWSFDSLADENNFPLISHHIAQNPDAQVNIQQYNSLLGLLFVLAFSPEKTKDWRTRLGYSGTNSSPHAEATNPMGPTQILPMIIMMYAQAEQEMLDNTFLLNLEQYIETGSLPSRENPQISTSESSVDSGLALFAVALLASVNQPKK
jgi:hypothetical protein